jgi:thioredoxin reductase (NADPH)
LADIKVYGAPWCPDCRRTKKFLSEQRIPYDWLDIDEDPEALRLVEELQSGGRRIPTVVFPDGSHLLEPSNDEVARKLGLQLKAKRPFYDLIIVGGGPAGLSAAIYAAREGMETLVIEKSALGGQAGVTERIENYPGFPEGIRGAELADRIAAQARRYDVELLSAMGARKIEREDADLCVTTDAGDEYGARAVLVATGSSYRRLGVPGEDDLIGAGVHFCATCDGPFYKGADELLVVGGGNSGLEEGVFLTGFAEKVRIVEFTSQLKTSRVLQDKVLNHPQMQVHLNTEVREMQGKNGKLSAVIARDRESGEEMTFHPAAVFVYIGLDPNSGFLDGTVDRDRWGFVVTDDGFQTSLRGVFAAGDVRAGSTKQLGAAIGEGIAAALMVRHYLQEGSHMRRGRPEPAQV